MFQTVVVTYPEFKAGENQAGKFLQLGLRGKKYLLLASRDQHRFHNQILAHFLADQGAACHWTNDEVLQIEEPALIIDGGGRFQLDAERQLLILSDNSLAYGRFDNEQVQNAFASAEGNWSELKIAIAE